MVRSNCLSSKDIEKLSKTEDGKKIVFNYIVSGRIALSVQQIFDKLNIVPTGNIQFDICNIIYDNLFKENLKALPFKTLMAEKELTLAKDAYETFNNFIKVSKEGGFTKQISQFNKCGRRSGRSSNNSKNGSWIKNR